MVVQNDIVIGADELVSRWIQGHNFDFWIVRLQPIDHVFPGLFGCRVANDKNVHVTVGA